MIFLIDELPFLFQSFSQTRKNANIANFALSVQLEIN